MFSLSKKAYLMANHLIWTQGCWRYLLIPIGLSMILAPALIGLCVFTAWHFGPAVANYFLRDSESAASAKHLFRVLILIAGLAPAYVAFRGLVMVCYAPFLDRLSAKADKIITGSGEETERGWFESMRRPVAMTILTLTASMLVMIAGLLVSLIPVIGVIVSFVFFLPLQLALSSISYVDPYLERRGYSARQSLALLRRYYYSLFVFGLVGLVFNLIPVVGWFVGPTYSVVAGIVFGIYVLEEKESNEPTTS